MRKTELYHLQNSRAESNPNQIAQRYGESIGGAKSPPACVRWLGSLLTLTMSFWPLAGAVSAVIPSETAFALKVAAPGAAGV